MSQGRVSSVVPLVLVALLARGAAAPARHPRHLQRPARQPRHARPARALPPLRRRRAHLRPPLRVHRAALVRARALLRARRLPDDDRADEVGVVAVAGRRGDGDRRDPRAAAARRDQPARRRDRLRDGDARVRAGRPGARAEEPRPADRRRGGPRPQLRSAPRLLRRRPEREEPLLARARLRGRRLPRRALRRLVLARARLAGDPRERAPRRGDRAAPVRLQADRVRARLVPLHDGRDRLAARARNRREPAGDDRQLHADLARDGRDRRRRHEVRRAARRLPLHAARPAARRARRLLAGAGSADHHPKAALGAPLHPRHALHPARLLRARRARRASAAACACCAVRPASKGAR